MGMSSQLSNDRSQFDEAAALAALDGQTELLADLAMMFREDSLQLLQTLNQAIAEDDRLEARRAVHSLKGLASAFFAKQTVDLAKMVGIAALRQFRRREGRLFENEQS